MPGPITPKERAALIKRRQQKAAPAGNVLSGISPQAKPHKAAPKPAPVPAPVAHAKPHAPKPAPVSNDPASITGPLTPAQLDKETAAAVRTRFGGTEKEIQGQQRVSDQMQTNLGGWFDQYKADVEAARQRTAAFNAGVQQAQNAQAQQAQAADTAIATTPEAQQAAAARRSTSDSFGSMLASQASSQNAYQADQGRIGSGEATHQHIAEAGRKRSLGDQLATLKGQEGDYAVGYRSDARAAERKNALENAAFGLDVAKAKTDASLKRAAQMSLESTTKATAKAKAKAATRAAMEHDRTYGLDKKKFGAAQAKDNYQRTHGLGPYKPASKPKTGPSRADQRAEQARKDKIREKSGTALTRIDDAKGAYDSLAGQPYKTGRVDPKTGKPVIDSKTGLPESRKPTDAEIRAELIKQHYSANEIHLALTPKWGPQEVAMAHQLGIRIPRSRLAYDPKIRAGSKADPKPTSGQQNGLGGK